MKTFNTSFNGDHYTVIVGTGEEIKPVYRSMYSAANAEHRAKTNLRPVYSGGATFSPERMYGICIYEQVFAPGCEPVPAFTVVNADVALRFLLY